jgi:hypothetical protein
MASIKEFVGSVAREGLMRNNRFSVLLSVPPAVSLGIDLRKVLLYCDSVTLPGLSIATAEAKTYGEVREMPYQRVFENIPMTFYVDNSMHVKLLFDTWLAAVINPGTREVNYYRDYVTDMSISVYDVNDKSRYEVTCYQCYPKSVSAVQMDYANKDVMKLTVNMVSKYWESYAAQSGGSGTKTAGVSTLFGQTLNGALGSLLGDSTKIPSTYFTNFNSFQTGVQSFENSRAPLFTSSPFATGIGGKLI